MSETAALTTGALAAVFRSACPGDPRPGGVAEAAAPAWIRSTEQAADVDELVITLTEGGGWWVGCCPAPHCQWYPASLDGDVLGGEALAHAAADHPDRSARIHTIPSGRGTAGL